MHNCFNYGKNERVSPISTSVILRSPRFEDHAATQQSTEKEKALTMQLPSPIAVAPLLQFGSVYAVTVDIVNILKYCAQLLIGSHT